MVVRGCLMSRSWKGCVRLAERGKEPLCLGPQDSFQFPASSSSFFFFHFWPPCGMWSSWARDQIRVVVATNSKAWAMQDPLTHCVGLGVEPTSWCCRDATRSCCATVGTPPVSCFLSREEDGQLWGGGKRGLWACGRTRF